MPNEKKKMKKPNSKKSTTSNKKKMKKPSASMLGTGMARQAADALAERERKRLKMMKEMGL